MPAKSLAPWRDRKTTLSRTARVDHKSAATHRDIENVNGGRNGGPGDRMGKPRPVVVLGMVVKLHDWAGDGAACRACHSPLRIIQCANCQPRTRFSCVSHHRKACSAIAILANSLQSRMRTRHARQARICNPLQEIHQPSRQLAASRMGNAMSGQISLRPRNWFVVHLSGGHQQSGPLLPATYGAAVTQSKSAGCVDIILLIAVSPG